MTDLARNTENWPPETLVEIRLATLRRLCASLHGQVELTQFEQALLAGRAMAGSSVWRRVENKLHLAELITDYTYVVD